MSEICGEPVPVVYSDMGDDPNKIIDRFRSSNQRWLVTVKMVSEGVDIPRACVGVYVSDQMTEMWFRQVVGRLVRIMGSDDEAVATMFIPNILGLCEIAQRIESEASVALEERSRPKMDKQPEELPKQESFDLLVPLDSSEAELSGIIRQGETVSSDEIAYAESLRNDAGIKAHVSEIVRLLRLNDQRQGIARHSASPNTNTSKPVGGDGERKALRKTINGLVNAVARRTGREQRDINFELIQRFGCSISEADADNMRQRIEYLRGMT
jgi:superfamily II DNA or RNA helicase